MKYLLAWLAALIAYVTVRPHGKMPFRDFLKALCNKLFILPVLCLFVYATLLVYGLSQFPFWDWILIKDVFIWVLFVATPICFKLGTKRTTDFPFRKIVAENFTGSAILEFFIGTFTFSFWTEMIVVPAFSLLVLLRNHDRNNPKYQSLHKVMDGISVIVGFALLWFTIDVAVDVISTEGVVDVLASFCITARNSPNVMGSPLLVPCFTVDFVVLLRALDLVVVFLRRLDFLFPLARESRNRYVLFLLSSYFLYV